MQTKLAMICFLVIFSMSTVFAEEISPVGTWISKGTFSDGTVFTGHVTISKRVDNLYDMEWKIDKDTYTGIGIYENGGMFACWGQEEQYGLIVYEMGEELWKGEWVSKQTGSYIGKQDVTPGSKTVNGIHTASGNDPNGVEYTGKLAVEAASTMENVNFYGMAWNINEKLYTGIGIQENGKNVLVAGWGIGTRYGVVIYKFEKDGAAGLWASPTGEHGTEELSKP